jgi:hypothetical protein
MEPVSIEAAQAAVSRMDISPLTALRRFGAERFGSSQILVWLFFVSLSNEYVFEYTSTSWWAVLGLNQ